MYQRRCRSFTFFLVYFLNISTSSCLVSRAFQLHDPSKITHNTSARPQHAALAKIENNKHVAKNTPPSNNRSVTSIPSHSSKRTPSKTSRRHLFLTAISTLLATSPLLAPPPASAACLSGDLSPTCIGIYKVPLDDAIIPYIDTPESLAKNCPDLTWVPPVVYPKTYEDAKEEMKALLPRSLRLTDLVARGKLEDAGVEILYITPRVTVCGRVILNELMNNAQSKDLSALKVEAAYESLRISLGQCDIYLGQGLRGQLGVSAVAQLSVMEDLKELNKVFGEFVRAIPDRV